MNPHLPTLLEFKEGTHNDYLQKFMNFEGGLNEVGKIDYKAIHDDVVAVIRTYNELAQEVQNAYLESNIPCNYRPRGGKQSSQKGGLYTLPGELRNVASGRFREFQPQQKRRCASCGKCVRQSKIKPIRRSKRDKRRG